MRFWCVLAVLFTGLLANASMAAEPAVRYVSLKRGEAFLREGPTYKHRVLWVYKRKGYPFQVVAHYDTWRRVRDSDGTVGWINDALLSSQRTVLVTGKGRVNIHADEAPASKIVAYADSGVVLELKACKPLVCEIVADGIEGWIDRKRIWGVGPLEVFQ